VNSNNEPLARVSRIPLGSAASLRAFVCGLGFAVIPDAVVPLTAPTGEDDVELAVTSRPQLARTLTAVTPSSPVVTLHRMIRGNLDFLSTLGGGSHRPAGGAR